MILCDTGAQAAASNENSRKPLLIVNLRQAGARRRLTDLGSISPHCRNELSMSLLGLLGGERPHERADELLVVLRCERCVGIKQRSVAYPNVLG